MRQLRTTVVIGKQGSLQVEDDAICSSAATSSSLQGKGRDGAAGTSRHGFKPRDKKLDREEI